MSVMDRVGNRVELLVPLILRLTGRTQVTITPRDMDDACQAFDGWPAILCVDGGDGSVTLRLVTQVQALQAQRGYDRLDQTRPT